MSTTVVGKVLFPVPVEQAPKAVELMLEALFRGLDKLKDIAERPVGNHPRVCCGDPGDCQHNCKERYDHWYREGPRVPLKNPALTRLDSVKLI